MTARLPGWLLLAITSLLWAFSFGLIGRELSNVPSTFVAAVRLALAFLVFLPFWRPGLLRWSRHAALITIGAVQYGLMYVLYIKSYAHLEGHEVAVLTALTPLYVVLFSTMWTRQTRGILRALGTALLAVIGAAVLRWRGTPDDSWTGVALVQLANICFALGQVAYAQHFGAKSDGESGVGHAKIFADLYLGGLLVAATAACMTLDAVPDVTPRQIATLAYLGLIPSGLGFFLWNVGATRVSSAALAVWNNVVVPLAVVASLVVFGETVRPVPLAISSMLIAIALVVSSRRRAPAQS